MTRAVELFAGIGGLALARPAGTELASAFDQSAPARATHELNHRVPVHAQDLATIGEAALDRAGARGATWLLSPPCQPFSRRGAGADVDDARCRGLLRLIELLPALAPRALLLENVTGFHGSRAHGLLTEALRRLDHEVEDVAHCPSDDGAPIRRPRHFVVASRDGLRPLGPASPPARLADCLDAAPDDALTVPTDWRERTGRIDEPSLPLPTVTRSYAHAASGGGPLLPSARGGRFLSPREILRLHDFPESFRFPADIDLRTRWRLAGNSVHVGSVRRVAARIA